MGNPRRRWRRFTIGSGLFALVTAGILGAFRPDPDIDVASTQFLVVAVLTCVCLVALCVLVLLYAIVRSKKRTRNLVAIVTAWRERH